MGRFHDFEPKGVIPATLLALNDDYSIDEAATRKHLRDCAMVPGVSAATVNGHASEVHACTFEEQRRILDASLDEVGDEVPLINGVYADGSHEAARIARMADDAGASCLLVFPPQSMTMGGQLRPEMALAHFKTIADATDLPIIVFEYPMTSGLGYPFDTLLKLFEEVPTIRAIKDWCADPMLHEKHTRTFQTLPRPINVLTTHSAWLMSSLVMGANGLLSGCGQRDRRSSGGAFRSGPGQGFGPRPSHQRSYRSADAGVLRAAVPRHAQPDEGMPGPARAPRQSGCASAFDEAR